MEISQLLPKGFVIEVVISRRRIQTIISKFYSKKAGIDFVMRDEG